MNKSDLISKMAEKAGLKKADAAKERIKMSFRDAASSIQTQHKKHKKTKDSDQKWGRKTTKHNKKKKECSNAYLITLIT